MKKIYTLLTAIAIVSFSFAQTQLTQANSAPTSGNSYTYYVADSSASPGAAGSGQTWDFSTLQGYGNSFSLDVVNASSTPDYPTYFSSSSVADTAAGQNKTYYTSTVDSLNSQGLIIPNAPTVGKVIVEFDGDDEKLLTYPFQMGNNFTDGISGTAYFNGVSAAVSGNVTVTADGSGTLKMPMGNIFSNVLRVKTVENLTGSFLGQTVTLSSTRYDFYDTDSSKYPILRFVQASFNGAQNNFVWSQYPLNAGAGIQTLANVNAFNIYPNPANNNVNINIDLKQAQNVQINIYDMTGRALKTITRTGLTGSNTFAINTSKFTTGIYNVVLQSNNKSISKRLFIK